MSKLPEKDQEKVNYTKKITVGRGKDIQIFSKLDDHYFIEFQPDVSNEQIKRLFEEKKFTVIKESLHPQVEGKEKEEKKNEINKRKFEGRWISTLPEEDIFAITKLETVRRIAPVYTVEGMGIETAAAPLPDILLVETLQEPSEDLINTLKNQFELHFAPALSKHLGKFSYFIMSDEGRARGTVYEIIDQLLQLEEITFVEFDWIVMRGYLLIPNDTHWGDQWNMTRINCVDGWDIETGNPNVSIAVLDSGFDLLHPDLTFTPIGDHFNGQEAANNDPQPYDASAQGNHGTAVAGLAGANLNNGQGIAGVAGGCRILPAFIGANFPQTAWAAAAINWAINHGASVISMSFSVAGTAALQAAIQNADAAGLVMVAATGNGNVNNIGFPAAYAEVIAVGATDQNDERKRPASPDNECWWGSNWGAELDVMAPGVLIWTTDRRGTVGYNQNGNPVTLTPACLGPGGTLTYPTTGDAGGNYFANFGGTSAATPQVAGLAGLIISHYPGLTNLQVRTIIEMTCNKVNPGTYPYVHDVNHPNGTWHQEMGYGLIDVAIAICEAGWVTAGAQPIELLTQSLTFNDVPENETHPRAVVFSIRSCRTFTFEIINGPTVTSGPPGTNFDTPLGQTTTLDTTLNFTTPREARIWVTYTGTTDGDTATGSMTIRCNETNEEWIIPITANTIKQRTVAAVLSLDKSNSMNFDSGIPDHRRIDVLRFSAPPFVYLLRENDAIGIVSFDHNAYDVMPVTPAGPEHIGAGRGTAISFIGEHTPNPEGWTSIGDGVEQAHLRLDPVTGYDVKATIVLTDGKENREKYISDVMNLINERVYAIGLGTAEVIQPTALNALTNGTGGYLLMTGELDINTYYLLTKYYLQILAAITNADIILDPEGYIRPGQEIRIPFQLNETDISSDVILLSPHPFLFAVSLETPDGRIIDPDTAPTTPGMLYVAESNANFYRMTLPVVTEGREVREGTWYVILRIDEHYYKKYLTSAEKGQKLNPHAIVETIQSEVPAKILHTHGVRYNLCVQTRSNLRINTSMAQNSYEPGATITLKVRLTEYGLPIKGRANVHAELTRPDKTKATLILKEVEPGVFETNTVALLSGIYKFLIKGGGITLKHNPFSREQLLTASVWKGGDNPPEHSSPQNKICCRSIIRLLWVGLILLAILIFLQLTILIMS